MKIEKINVTVARKKQLGTCASPPAAAGPVDIAVVEVWTDNGYRGVGEVCIPGLVHAPYSVHEVHGALKVMCPHLVGSNPIELSRIGAVMDQHVIGHPEVKAAIDTACWDIFGKVCGQPVCALLGGQFGDSLEVWYQLREAEPSVMIEKMKSMHLSGFKHFRLNMTASANTHKEISRITRLHGEMDKDGILEIDVAGKWLAAHAVQISTALPKLNTILRQPCRSYEECLEVRKRCNVTMSLDYTVIDDVRQIVKVHTDCAADVFVLSPCRLGGISKAKLVRDLCVSLGHQVSFEDAWGGAISQTAAAHLALSTQVQHRLPTTHFADKLDIRYAQGGFHRDYKMSMNNSDSGLGIQVIENITGKPVLTFQ